MAVNVGLMPVTGLTLLEWSAWVGTSIWFNGLALGIILSVSVNIQDRKERIQEQLVPA